MYFSINVLPLIISLEASTGIEPVYTDLQSKQIIILQQLTDRCIS